MLHLSPQFVQLFMSIFKFQNLKSFRGLTGLHIERIWILQWTLCPVRCTQGQNNVKTKYLRNLHKTKLFFINCTVEYWIIFSEINRYQWFLDWLICIGFRRSGRFEKSDPDPLIKGSVPEHKYMYVQCTLYCTVVSKDII